MNSTVKLEAITAINYITPENASFNKTKGGLLAVIIDGKEYARITLSRALPFTSPDLYISILDEEQKELGIIRDIAEFPGEQGDIIKQELSLRYYSPNITKINLAREKMGYLYLDVKTTAGDKNIAIKDISKSLRRLSDGRIIIFDVEGNRYYIRDVSDLDNASLKRIETYLV